MSQLIEPLPLSLIPESAPFTVEQRAWLNGFFAGWLGLTGEVPTSAATFTSPAAAPSTESEEEFPWHEPSLPLEERLTLANDKPLPRRLMAAMAQLDCGACGYVCKTYAEKIAAGEETCLTLCSPGGKETSKALKQLLKPSPPAASQTKTSSSSKTSGSTTEWSRHKPYLATVLKVVNLNGPGSDKQTSHVELDLGDSGLSYTVGDSLGVIPTNCHELVDDLIGRLGVRGDESVLRELTSMSLREALTMHCCLTELSEELLTCLADAADEEEALALRSLIDDDGPLNGCDVLDVLRLFPTAKPDSGAFVAALSGLRPRLYSISSSQTAHPREVHLTIGRVSWDHNGRTRKGVASTMFADRMSPGQKVAIFVQKSHGFTVPPDPATPMIMVGPGTGIAPFRAFLEERAASGATGRNWLFFGDRRESCDFLYRDQLESWRSAGLLTRLDAAFSRDSDVKTYVQDRMRQSGAELWRWLQEGASFFVCGDAKRMALDVDRALREIVSEHGGMAPGEAHLYVEQLSKTGRYRRDVY